MESGVVMKKILFTVIGLLLFVNTINIINPVFAEVSPSLESSFEEKDRWVSMFGGLSEGQFNFSKLQQYPQPFIDQNGRTMFPLNYFNEIFRDGVSYEINNNTITITKNILDVITVVSVTIDSNILIRNNKEMIMDTVPVQKGEIIYIPLSWIGESLGYNVFWREGIVEFHQFTALFVYVWNENKDSSPNELRYSYLISEDSDDLSVIKKNATSNVEEIYAVMKKLPQGSEILTTALYAPKGYKVPYDVWDGIVSKISDNGFISSYTTRCISEIPPIIKDLDDWTNEWYSEELFALDETAIYDSTEQIYRFSYIPSFTNPFVVQIKINDDGTADMDYKIGNGNANAHGGGILRSETASLTKEETKKFLDLLDEKEYWLMPAEIDVLGHDGYNAVIEGTKNGIYHIVDRWCPQKDDPVYSIEEYFIDLIKKTFGESAL